jgi:hypothetical protein
LHILELKRHGGPSDEDISSCRDFAQELGEKGDILLFKGSKPGESAEMFNKLARAIAILSFCPGGVCVFGHRYDAQEFPL